MLKADKAHLWFCAERQLALGSAFVVPAEPRTRQPLTPAAAARQVSPGRRPRARPCAGPPGMAALRRPLLGGTPDPESPPGTPPGGASPPVYVELPWRTREGSPSRASGACGGPGARIAARVAAVERAMARLVRAARVPADRFLWLAGQLGEAVGRYSSAAGALKRAAMPALRNSSIKQGWCVETEV